MIGKIAELLKTEIETLNWTDKVGGIVKPIPYKDKAGNDKIIPGYLNNSADACNTGVYLDFVPDSSKKSIIYFEDQGINTLNAGCHFIDCEASLKLVCWVNLAKINVEYTDAALLKANLIRAIPQRLPNTDYLVKILTMFAGEEPRTTDIFSRYSYDESKNQYLMYPYDFFALNYKVRFSIAPSECLDDIDLNPKIC